MMEQNNMVFCDSVDALPVDSGYYVTKPTDALVASRSRDVEMLRLIGQYLCDKGLSGSYAQLSKESGISLEHVDATELRHAILDGRWIEAEAALERLVPLMGDQDNVEEVRFLLLEQHFLEYLEDEDVVSAVTLLRHRITPMQRNTERVHTLASCLMCRTLDELKLQAGGWAGKQTGSRLNLISRVQSYVPPQTMLPPRRLSELINEAVHNQLTACVFHNPPPDSVLDFQRISLLQRHCCGLQEFPVFCVQKLAQRDSDLWLCQFSPNGIYLATGGKEANVDVWKVDMIRHTVTSVRTLVTPAYISSICWSPDSKKLAACCGEEQSCVCVFNVATGEQLCNRRIQDDDTYTAATFFGDSRKLAFGGLRGNFYVIDTEDQQGRVLRTVEGCRVQSMVAALSPNQWSRESTKSPPINPSATPVGTPGAPDSPATAVTVASTPDASGTPGCTNMNIVADCLLIADHLHRIRLFRFGAPKGAESAGTNAVVVSTGDNPSSAPAAMQFPGSIFTTTIGAGDTSEVGVSTTIATTPVGTASNLSVTLTRMASLQTQGVQTPSGGGAATRSSGMQQAGSGHGTVGSAYPMLVGGSSSSSSGGIGVSGTGLTIVVGTPLDRPVSGGAGSGIGASTDVRALNPGPRAIASFMHPFSSMGTSASQSDTGVISTGTVTGVGSGSTGSSVDVSSGPVISTTSTLGAVNLAPVITSTSTGSSTSTAVNNQSTSGDSNYTLLDHRMLFQETHAVQSIAIDKSCQYALITAHKMGLHLWDLKANAITQRFVGFKQDTFRLHSTFGGAKDDFVASGSEDGHIHMWKFDRGSQPIHSISPISSNNRWPITCVHWNPMLPSMLASVNDAGELCIWGPQRYVFNPGQQMDSL